MTMPDPPVLTRAEQKEPSVGPAVPSALPLTIASRALGDKDKRMKSRQEKVGDIFSRMVGVGWVGGLNYG